MTKTKAQAEAKHNPNRIPLANAYNAAKILQKRRRAKAELEALRRRTKLLNQKLEEDEEVKEIKDDLDDILRAMWNDDQRTLCDAKWNPNRIPLANAYKDTKILLKRLRARYAAIIGGETQPKPLSAADEKSPKSKNRKSLKTSKGHKGAKL